MAAPEQNIVDVSWDYKKFDEQTQLIIADMKAVYEAARKITDFKIAPGSTGGFTELNAKVKGLNEQTEILNANNQKLVTTIQGVNTANNQQAASTGQVVVATNAQNKSLVDNIKGLNDYKSALSANIAQQKLLKKDMDAGRITADEYRKKLTELSTDHAKLRVRVSELRKETNGQIKDVIGVNGAYARLNQQYLIAQTNAKNLAAAYGIESKEAQAAAVKALALNTELQAIDKTVGQSQKNVGNYGSAISGVEGIFSGLRTLANIIPGLGIGGIVLFAIEPLIEAVQYITKASDATTKLARNKQLLEDINKEGNKNASEEITNLKLLYDATQNHALAVGVREKAAVSLQKTYPETFANFTKEQILLGEAKAGYDALTKSILANAMAEAGRVKLAELANQELDARLKFIKDIVKAGEDEIKATRDANSSISRFSGRNVEQKDTKDAINAVKNNYKNIKDGAKQAYIDTLKDIREQEDLIIKAVGAGNLVNQLTKDDKAGKAAKVSDVKESTKEITDAEFEIYKINQQRKIKLLDAEQKDIKRGLGERLLIADMYNEAVIELQNKQTQKEIDVENKKQAALNANLKKAKGTERNNILAELEDSHNKVKVLTAKNADELLTIEGNYIKERAAIFDSDAAQTIKRAEDAAKNLRSVQQSAIDADQSLRIAAIDIQYKKDIEAAGDNKEKKEKIQKAYALAKAKIDNDSLILSLQSQKLEAEGLRSIAKLKGEDLTRYDNEINTLTGKIITAQNKVFDNGVKDTKGLSDEQKKYMDQYLQIGTATAHTIQALVDANFNRQVDQINKLIDLNNKQHEQEVKNIEGSTLSAQEKANALIIEEKKVAANNAALQRQANEIKRKQAKADRDAAILEIVANAVVAEFKLIGQSGYAGIVAGAVIAASAAAQIATILSKPLPSYFTETDNHPGGPARYGEIPEVVTEPGKRPYVQWTETIGMLPRGTKVKHLTSENVMDAAGGAMVSGTAERLAMAERAEAIRNNDRKFDELKDAVLTTGAMQVQAIRKMKQGQTNITVNGMWNAKIEREVRR